MKKKVLLFTAIAGFAFTILSSESSGPGRSGIDATGAETGLSNPTGCSTGSGCHGAANRPTTNIGVAIELDSAGGVATTHYKPGMTYTVKITGTNNGTTVQPKFGFQMTAITGSTAVTTPTNAGTWSTSTPTGTHYMPASSSFGGFVVNLVEHSMALNATTLAGAHGATYVESFTWTAPAAGTGTISFWGALNAVNGNTASDAGDLWNTTHTVINEWPASTSIANISNTISVKVFPNPVVNVLNLELENTQAGNYTVQVLDQVGKSVANAQLQATGSNTTATLNTNNWVPGLYQVIVEKDGNRAITSVVKQ